MCACMHVTCLSIYICTQPQESLDRERLSLEGVVVKEIQVCVSESTCLCACVGSLICAPCYLTFSVLCRPAPTIPKNSHAFKSQARIGCDSDLRSLLSDGFGVCACLPPFSSLTFANDFCRLALAAIQICARCSLMVLAPRRPTWRRPRGGSARRWQQPKRRCVCVCVCCKSVGVHLQRGLAAADLAAAEGRQREAPAAIEKKVGAENSKKYAHSSFVCTVVKQSNLANPQTHYIHYRWSCCLRRTARC